MSQQGSTDPTSRVIHAAILGGTLLFCAVVFFLLQGREAQPTTLFRWAWLAYAIAGTFGAGFVRGRLPRDASLARRPAVSPSAASSGMSSRSRGRAKRGSRLVGSSA